MFLASLCGVAAAQGTFTNFETPQTHPIEVATIGGVELVLVCNTPDNSLEVWTAASPPAQRARISVGMGPGTVRWNAGRQCAYACNLDGDSVSVVSVAVSGTQVNAALLRTTAVGDEPADIAFSPNNAIAFVTKLNNGGPSNFVLFMGTPNPSGLPAPPPPIIAGAPAWVLNPVTLAVNGTGPSGAFVYFSSPVPVNPSLIGMRFAVQEMVSLPGFADAAVSNGVSSPVGW